jgi:hypothetical protein
MSFLTLFQPISIVNSPRLRTILLMLRSDLNESDIPGRTTMHSRIKELSEEHLDGLARKMKVRLGFFLNFF